MRENEKIPDLEFFHCDVNVDFFYIFSFFPFLLFPSMSLVHETQLHDNMNDTAEEKGERTQRSERDTHADFCVQFIFSHNMKYDVAEYTIKQQQTIFMGGSR